MARRARRAGEGGGEGCGGAGEWGEGREAAEGGVNFVHCHRNHGWCRDTISGIVRFWPSVVVLSPEFPKQTHWVSYEKICANLRQRVVFSF